MNVSSVGPFIQYYFDPTSGFYLQGYVGYASGNSQYDSGGTTYQSESATGPAFGIGLGYDFWISDQWSIGPEFRFLYASLKYSGSGPDEEDKVYIPTLSIAGTLH